MYVSGFLKRPERALDPWSWSYRWCVTAWVLGTELRSLVSAVQVPQLVSLSPALHFNLSSPCKNLGIHYMGFLLLSLYNLVGLTHATSHI